MCTTHLAGPIHLIHTRHRHTRHHWHPQTWLSCKGTACSSCLAWCGARRAPVHEPFLPHHCLPRHPQDITSTIFPLTGQQCHASYLSPARTAYWRLHAALRHCNSSSILSPRHLCVILVSSTANRAAFFALDAPVFIFPHCPGSYEGSNIIRDWLWEPRIDLQFLLPSFCFAPFVVDLHTNHRRGNTVDSGTIVAVDHHRPSFYSNLQIWAPYLISSTVLSPKITAGPLHTFDINRYTYSGPTDGPLTDLQLAPRPRRIENTFL